MNKKLHRELKSCYPAPPPLRKSDFLDRLPLPELTLFQFVRIQISYISKWIWLFSALLFAGALFFGQIPDKQLLSLFSAALPFLVFAAVCELGRAERFGMNELEAASRFPHKAVVLAKMGILGLENGLLLAALSPVFLLYCRIPVIYLGIHILLPYLLTAFSNLYIARKIHGPESFYTCMAVTVLISVFFAAVPLFPSLGELLLQTKTWLLIGVLVILTGNECRKIIFKTEEILWN